VGFFQLQKLLFILTAAFGHFFCSTFAWVLLPGNDTNVGKPPFAEMAVQFYTISG
jgi:hypothetical protein